MSITWEEPPSPARGRGCVPPYGLEAFDELRQNPGRWALLHTYDDRGAASAQAQVLREGRRKGIEYGEFESVSRRVSDGYALYARYIGGEK